MTANWPIISLFLFDLVILLFLLLLLGRLRKGSVGFGEERLRELSQTLKALLEDTESASMKLSEEIEREKEALAQLSMDLDKRKRDLHLAAAETKGRRGEEGVPAAESSAVSNVYEQVLELKEKGFGQEEIMDRVRISKGELEMILNLQNI